MERQRGRLRDLWRLRPFACSRDSRALLRLASLHFHVLLYFDPSPCRAAAILLTTSHTFIKINKKFGSRNTQLYQYVSTLKTLNSLESLYESTEM